jgi:hypothetical protein
MGHEIVKELGAALACLTLIHFKNFILNLFWNKCKINELFVTDPVTELLLMELLTGVSNVGVFFKPHRLLPDLINKAVVW